jgi:hypothetical protein
MVLHGCIRGVACGMKGGEGSCGTDLRGELGPSLGLASLAFLLVGGTRTYVHRAL